MTALSDFCNTCRAWLNLGEDVYPDPLVASWVKMAEEYLSETLRVKHMIQIDSSPLIQGRVLLPADWQELDTVRFVNSKPLIYVPRDEYYAGNAKGTYTIVGNYILVSHVDPVSGTPVEISYYQNIPPLGDDPNWLLNFYSRIYTLCTLWHASMYAIEDDRGDNWKTATTDFVSEMNTKHQLSKASGSVLIRKRSTFG